MVVESWFLDVDRSVLVDVVVVLVVVNGSSVVVVLCVVVDGFSLVCNSGWPLIEIESSVKDVDKNITTAKTAMSGKIRAIERAVYTVLLGISDC